MASQLLILEIQGSNFIIAIVAMESEKGKMAMDKMKLYLKS